MDPLLKMRDAALGALVSGGLSPVDEESIERAYLPLAARLGRSCQVSRATTRIVALVGSPGSGKSTLSEYLALMLTAGFGLRVARFGIDDLYLNQAERRALGRQVHPLFENRGAPGTHRIEQAATLFSALRGATPGTVSALPRFDKSKDDTSPFDEWPKFQGRPDLVLFDTWLWNVRAPSDEELSVPINSREAEQDPDGVWRRASAHALRTRYLAVFEEADEWVRLETPGWESMVRFREEQEFNRLSRLGEDARELMRNRELPIAYFLELLQRWLRLPHASEPNYRIVLDEQHSARLLA